MTNNPTGEGCGTTRTAEPPKSEAQHSWTDANRVRSPRSQRDVPRRCGTCGVWETDQTQQSACIDPSLSPHEAAASRLMRRGYLYPPLTPYPTAGDIDLAMAVYRHGEAAAADIQDLADAIRLLPFARDSLDIAEFTLIRAARAAEMTWEEIGELLGIPDKRTAQRHQVRLTDRIARRFLGKRDPDQEEGDRGGL